MPISEQLLVPGVFVTIDPTAAVAGSLTKPSKTVFIGQKHSGGTANAEEYVQIFSREDGAAKVGKGSMLDEMFAKWYANNQFNELYMVALDDVAGTKRADTLTFTGTATAGGTVFLYINGVQVQIPVIVGDTETDVADAVTAAIGGTISLKDYPVTASNLAGVVTITAKNSGTVGNQIKLKMNLNTGESLPAGITAVFASSAVGATDPVVADAIAALPDDIINWFAMPYVDSTSTGAMADELDRRWGNTVQLNGQLYIAQGGTTATVTAFGDTLNHEQTNVIDTGLDSRNASYQWTAAQVAVAAREIEIDPARPLRSLPLIGIYGDTLTNKRKDADRQLILSSGVQTHTLANDGTVTIERTVTTYKENSVGSPDSSYQEMNTVSILAYMRETTITWVNLKFPRHKLANDGTIFGEGDPIVTPNSMADSLADLYESDWIRKGIAENLQAYITTMSVIRHPTIRTRLVAVTKPILISPFYQLDNTLQFIL